MRTQKIAERLRSDHRKKMTEWAQMGAEQALKNKPAPTGEELEVRVGPIRSYYQGFVSVLHMDGVRSHGEEARADKRLSDTTMDMRRGQIAETMEKLRNMEIDHGRVHLHYPWERYTWVMVAYFVVALGETLYNMNAFQILRGPRWQAIGLAISISMATVWYSKMLLRFILDARTRIGRIVRLVISTLFTMAVFLGIGALRAGWVERELSGAELLLNPHTWIFMLVNMLFVIVFMGIDHKYAPTKQDHVDKERKESLKEDVSRLEGQLRKLRKEGIREGRELNESYKRRHREVVRTKEHESEVKEMFRAAVSEYIRENLLRRTDGEVPDCFSQFVEPIKGRLDDVEV